MLPYRPSVHALLSIKIPFSLSLENKLKMEHITNTLPVYGVRIKKTHLY